MFLDFERKEKNDAIDVMHDSFNNFLSTGDKNNIVRLKMSYAHLERKLSFTKDPKEISNINKKMRAIEHLIKSMESLSLRTKRRGFF